MKITFGQQTTKVKQLADLISQEISMGTYKSDSALPSINQLSRNYHVSRDTVFKAFIDLKDRGMIDSTPGKGYYVTNWRIFYCCWMNTPNSNIHFTTVSSRNYRLIIKWTCFSTNIMKDCSTPLSANHREDTTNISWWTSTMKSSPAIFIR